MASVINKPFFKFNFEPDDGSLLTAPPDIRIIINILTRHLDFRHLAPKHKTYLPGKRFVFNQLEKLEAAKAA